MSGTTPDLVVAVPARNEADRIAACLSSLANQGSGARILVSDNASEDETAAIASAFQDRLDLSVRTTGPLGPSEHFVSAGRWALEQEPAAAYFALLAGDDEWAPGFVEAALGTLDRHPDAGVACPSFVWTGGDEPARLLEALGFEQPDGSRRRRRALTTPDRNELANLVYGVYRRQAFEDLLDAWEAGGDAFGADYAAAWSVIGKHPVAASPHAVGHRHVRAGTDLVERAVGSRPTGGGLAAQAVFYVRLNVRVNSLIADALGRVADEAPARWWVHTVRAPQWVAGSFFHVAGHRAQVGRDTVRS